MTTYAVLTVPGHGHINPTLALAQELIVRGERVVYYQSEAFRSAIEVTGAVFRLYNSEAWKKYLPRIASTAAGKLDLAKRVGLLAELAIDCVQEMPWLLQQMTADHIDCVLYDRIFMPGVLTSLALHLPAVQLNPSFMINAQAFKQVAGAAAVHERPALDWWNGLNERLAHACEAYKLPPAMFGDLLNRVEDVNIAFLPRAFQPAAETFDERYVFVGPSLPVQRHGDSDFAVQQLDKRPLLYISLGTAFNDQIDFYRMCFDAFAQSKWQVVLSFGSRIDASALGEPPANFHIAAHVPQLEVLSQTDLFISHGGMNSIMESIWFGVPLIVVPQMIEQEMNARRVQELGLGLFLEKETLTAETLRTAVAQVSHDAGFQEHVQEMQQEMRRSGGYRRASDEITRYLQRL